ncbi:hypothetical protein [Paenarthrobacter ilicis]|uniref:hypothetical protein n=1 Tax=Paenarthrobacter ilicis TaxID=43665 RepID=UPI0028D451D2|nr:hypothetical protein [Paenarthrobacter ilicis]
MAIEVTPLGFKKPDGNEMVRGGDNAISDNAQKADDLIQEQRTQIADLQYRTTSHIDGGTPDAIYTPEQSIDGGTV